VQSAPPRGSDQRGHQAGERLGHVSRELGGKNPSIVYLDAVDDDLIDGLRLALRFTRQGQSCTAGSRLFLHEDIYDEVLDRLISRLGALKVGDPLDETSDLGAIIDGKQHASIDDYLADGRSHSAMTVALGASAPFEGVLAEGLCHLPTVFAGARNDFRLAQKEIFGPVLVAIPWREVDEVVQMANDSNYVPAAFVRSHDLDAALNAALVTESGTGDAGTGDAGTGDAGTGNPCR